jgi:hypothetical protein
MRTALLLDQLLLGLGTFGNGGLFRVWRGPRAHERESMPLWSVQGSNRAESCHKNVA